MSRVYDWLYLGSMYDAIDSIFLYTKEIDVIINVARELKDIKYPKDVEIYFFPFDDAPWEHIDGHFDSVYMLMELSRLKGKRVLIHCKAGISRSASFVIYYLMERKKIKSVKALLHLQKIRPIVNPNSGFLFELYFVGKNKGYM